MRPFLVLAAALYAAPALAGDPAFEVGAQAGAILVDELDTIHTSWYVAPKLGFWFTHGAGLEVDVGLSTGNTDATGHKFLLVAPQLQFVGNPIPEEKHSPVQPIITLGVGLWDKMIDGKGVRGEDYAHTRMEAMGSFGTGLIIPIVGPLHFRTDARMLVTAAREDELYRSPFIDFLWTAGLGVNIKLAKDTDKDKIPDKHGDLCPTDPEDFDQFQDEDGCPDLDNDADGIKDDVDECKNEAEDLDGFEDANGCPDPDNDGDHVPDTVDECPNDAEDRDGNVDDDGCPDHDDDGDGIPDTRDNCPLDAEDFDGDADEDGCPEDAADSDNDGILDVADKCPKLAEDRDGFEDEDGCPDADNDGDGILDAADLCPRAPETLNGFKDDDGCPDETKATLEGNKIVITDTILFYFNEARIKEESFPVLDAVKGVVLAHPEIVRLRVEGHTDSQGSDAYNQDLSERRALAVRQYLIDHGVESTRLLARGYGERYPIAPNGDETGRAKNRRVEFIVLKPEDDGGADASDALDEGSAAPEAAKVRPHA